jgi:hypothetical protein
MYSLNSAVKREYKIYKYTFPFKMIIILDTFLPIIPKANISTNMTNYVLCTFNNIFEIRKIQKLENTETR